MKKNLTILFTLAMLAGFVSVASARPLSDTTVMSVVEDEYVTIRLGNFPKNDTYYVYMGYRDTQGLNGHLVSKITTNSGGTFLAKFLIPDELNNEEVISIRFESKYGNDLWFNFFYNMTTTYSGSGGSGTTYNNLKPGFPTFILLELVKGRSITVQTKYFPENERWAVFLNSGHGAEINQGWIEVNGFNSADGGVQTVHLNIPSSLQYEEKIAVMFYNVDDGFRTYDLYLNQHYP